MAYEDEDHDWHDEWDELQSLQPSPSSRRGSSRWPCEYLGMREDGNQVRLPIRVRFPKKHAGDITISSRLRNGGKVRKYGNKPTNGYSSKREAGRAQELKLLERAGHISGLREQVVFELAPSVVIQGRKRPPLRYIADFVYMENSKEVVEDSKGFRTDSYRIRRHLMKSLHNIDILET